MDKPLFVSENEKWEAIVSCDESYDGLFLYGVKTTGIFCHPSCRAKTPCRSNVVFFNDSADAVDAGFRPCKRCCPDKAAFEPGLELVEKAKDIFDANFDDLLGMGELSKQLGVSPNHLARLFHKHFGMSPTKYITRLRVDKASGLLEQTDAGILEIAYISGFKSLSGFYKCFKEHTGLTPREYREYGGSRQCR